jgi:hypothetical protein
LPLEAETNDGMFGVQFEGCSEGGQNAGWIDGGDYIEWRIDVPSTGSYVVTSRSATTGAASLNVLVDGANKATLNMTASGGWQNWADFSTSAFSMNAGTRTLRIAFTSGNQNMNNVRVSAGAGGGASCSDNIQNQGETGVDCGGPCSACGGGGGSECVIDSDCSGGEVCGNGDCMTEAAVFRNQGGTGDKSFKRGLPFHYCGWPDSRGGADLDAVKSGITWYYNWGSGPLECNDGAANDSGHSVKSHSAINKYDDATNGVEFVPMVWGFDHAGAGCADANNDKIPDGACYLVDNNKGSDYCFRAGGECTDAQSNGSDDTRFNPTSPCWQCLHEKVTHTQLVSRIPAGSRYLLCGNEPNFYEQASMTPVQMASMWKYCEKVAEERDLELVSPAVNFCGPDWSGGTAGAGECINSGRTQLFAWLDEFYHECEAGKNGRSGSGNYSGPGVGNCKVDYNAMHTYSADSSQTWALDMIAGWKNDTNTDFAVWSVSDPYVDAQSKKKYWITEFAPEWTGGERNTVDRMNDNLNEYEQSGDVFRYSHFMQRVAPDMPSLDKNDISCATGNNTATITNTGKCYLKHPSNAANSQQTGTYVPECDYLNAAPAQQTYCCSDDFYGLCVEGMLKNCTTDADCDGRTSCVIDGGTRGACMAKACTNEAECPSGYQCDDGNPADQWPGACRPTPHFLSAEAGHQ